MKRVALIAGVLMCMACTVDVRIDRGPGTDATQLGDGAEVNDARAFPVPDGALSPSDAGPLDATAGS